MASPVKTRLRLIVPKVTAQLAAVTGVSPDLVLLSARQDVPHFQGDADIVVRLGPPSPVPGHSHGLGRLSTLVERVVQVTPRSRRQVDQSDRDDYALLDPDEGLWRLEDLVVDALHIWVPLADNGDDWLASAPLEWVPGGAPVHETPYSQSWVHSDLLFKLQYETDLTDNGY